VVVAGRFDADADRLSVGKLTTSTTAPAFVTPVAERHLQTHVISDARPADWDAYVNGSPDATIYHLTAWRGVFERAFGHRSEYLSAHRNGTILGVLPLVEMRSWLFGKFMVSLPFVNYGGVLADDDQTASTLFEHAGRLATQRGLSHVELRHLRQRFPNAPAKRHKVTMKLALAPDTEAMWGILDRKVRNQVRKAEKVGLVCEIGGKELIDAFYSVFATNMRDLGTPVYAKRFFEEIFAAFNDQTTMLVVRTSNGAAIAAGIGLRYRDTLEMPWASSLKAYRAMCANNLLYWCAIKHAISRGCTSFDFGRSTPNEGTYNFKQQWGAEPEPLCWEYSLSRNASMPDQSPKNPKFSVAIEIWKRLPQWAANAIGPGIVRSIP
jgi:FemAB-related protein (PEP-CTERM system-associated)